MFNENDCIRYKRSAQFKLMEKLGWYKNKNTQELNFEIFIFLIVLMELEAEDHYRLLTGQDLHE